jgi:hypothetical protein
MFFVDTVSQLTKDINPFAMVFDVIQETRLSVRYFSSDEVSTPQGIVPCTICSVGNVIHFLIVELSIVSDNKVKNKIGTEVSYHNFNLRNVYVIRIF